MSLEHVCRKKDKRLLVLLALGALIMFSDFAVPVKFKPAACAQSWLEIQDEVNRLYRIVSPGHNSDAIVNVMVADRENIPVQVSDKQIFGIIKQGRAPAFQKNQPLATSAMPVSPRLAFFLGQPFSINIADAEDLTLIPGVGPVLAGNIIAFREKHGPITDSSQLENIPGVGPRMKLKLLNYLTCSLDCE